MARNRLQSCKYGVQPGPRGLVRGERRRGHSPGQARVRRAAEVDAGPLPPGGARRGRLAGARRQARAAKAPRPGALPRRARRAVPRGAAGISKAGPGLSGKVQRQRPAGRRDGPGQDGAVAGVRGHRKEGVSRPGGRPPGDAEQLAPGDPAVPPGAGAATATSCTAGAPRSR